MQAISHVLTLVDCELVLHSSAGGVDTWQSKLTGNASLSSCESEYMGLANTGQEVSWMRTLQLQMQGKDAVAQPIRIFMDSQPAIDLLNNPVHHPKSKQILARYHFIRDRVHNEKELTVEKCSAAQMGADMLTKHASVGVIRYNRKILGMF